MFLYWHMFYREISACCLDFRNYIMVVTTGNLLLMQFAGMSSLLWLGRFQLSENDLKRHNKLKRNKENK